MSTETTIATTAKQMSGFATQTPGEQLFSLSVFGVGALVSGAFVYYLFTNPACLIELWAWTRSLHILLQGVIWLLFGPWMICLWVWTLAWTMPIRLAVVMAALAWTNWLLWPWK